MASYNTWDPYAMPVSGQWQNWDPTQTDPNALNPDGSRANMAYNLDPQWLASLGFTGNAQDANQYNQQNGNQSATTSQDLINWLKSNGYNLQYNTSDENHGNKYLGRLTDSSGNQIGQGQQWGMGNDDAFGLAMLAAGGFAGAAAAGAGAGAAGAGGTAGSGGGAGIGADQLAYGSLENGASYGGGYGGSLTASSEPGFGGASFGYEAPTAVSNSTAGLSGVDGAGGMANAEGAYPGAFGGSGGIGGTGSTDAMNAYLTSGASDGSTVGGLGGYAGSVGSNAGAEGLTSAVPGAATSTNYGTMLQNLFSPAKTAGTAAGALSGSGSNGSLGSGLIGLAGALGAFGKGDTSLLNNVNYQNAATAQGQSARTNQTNAQGSLTYNQNGVDAQGNPTYSQNVQLNAPYQQNLNQALGNQSTALGNLQNYNSGLSAAYANAPSVYGNAGSQQALAQQEQDAMYDQQKRYLDPQYDLQAKQLQAQLANQGVTYGTDAYNNAMTQFGSQQNQAYGTARDSAINSGNQYANTLFNQGLQANQLYNTNLNNQGANLSNQASSALNGVVQNPTFAQTPAATNYLGAAGLQGQANLNQYNAQTGNANSMTRGLTGIGQRLFSNPGVWSSIGSGLSNIFGNG